MKNLQLTQKLLRVTPYLLIILGLCEACTPYPPDQAPIWRAQLYVKVCDVKDSGTDNSVNASLSGSNLTWLDYPRDDFERNNGFTYDLQLDGLLTFDSIKMLQIAKTGSNGVCVKTLKLTLNHYYEVFNKTFASGHWLDHNDLSLMISEAEIKTNPSWPRQIYLFPPSQISRSELISRIASTVGHQIHYASPPRGHLEWGRYHGGPIELKRVDNNTIAVDLDLKLNINNLPDADVDIDFDLKVECVNNTLLMRLANQRTTIDWFFLDKEIDGSDKSLGTIGVPQCPVITVENDGSITFQSSQ